MNIFARKDHKDKFDHLIESSIHKLNELDETDEDYAKILSLLERLEKLKKEVYEPKLDPNKTLAVAANLAGIIAVLNYEQAHVIGSKALSLVMKVK